MSPQMLGEAVFALELHPALLANVLDLVQFHVTVEILLRLELLLAGLALKLLHLRLVLVMFVEVEGAFARIRGAAYVAHARLRVVVLHVGRVIRLHLEHLPALLALVIVILRVLPDVMDLEIGFGARFEVAQAARVQIDRLVVYLHVPGQVSRRFEPFRANGALVRPRVAVLEHVPGVLALTVERCVTDLACVHLLLWNLFARFALLLFLPLSKVQRRVVEIVERVVRARVILRFLFRLVVVVVRFPRFHDFAFRRRLGVRLSVRIRFLHHEHAQRRWYPKVIIF